MGPKHCLFLGAILLDLSGCASAQLNYNTLDLASTTDQLLTRQVLYNLEKFVDSETAIPAQLTISSGSASTTNSISPGFSTPFDAISATTRAVEQTTSTKITNTTVITKNPASASVNGTDLWSQNWSFSPISDVQQMRRLRALYRYAVDGDARAFLDRYPILYKTVTESRLACLRDENGEIKTKVTIDSNQAYTSCVTGASPISNGKAMVQTANGASQSSARLVPDEHYLKRPGCVVCLRLEEGAYGKGNRVINETLRAGWLRWINLSGAGNKEERSPAPHDVSMGVYGHHELFVAKGQTDKFVEFTMFVLAASTQTDATSPTGGFGGGRNGYGGGGGGDRGGTKAATQSVVGPDGAISTIQGN
jgi:hypothetical protein